MKTILFYLLSALILVSCGPTRKLAYFSDLQEQGVYKENIRNNVEPKIQADDLLSINITSLNPEANALFNSGVVSSEGNAKDQGTVGGSTGYLVDRDGFVDLPVLNKVKLGGLTKEEAKAKLVASLNEYLKEPRVNIRFLNYKITVIGEVNRPSTFTIPTEKINILEALGMAGDMTAYGKRENVLIIRETEGIRTITRLNLNEKDVLNSPFFYLKQNDVVYVEPDKARNLQASTTSYYLPIVVASVSVLTLVLSRFF
jgi:polysaccharide biosynthesis/export protein